MTSFDQKTWAAQHVKCKYLGLVQGFLHLCTFLKNCTTAVACTLSLADHMFAGVKAERGKASDIIRVAPHLQPAWDQCSLSQLLSYRLQVSKWDERLVLVDQPHVQDRPRLQVDGTSQQGHLQTAMAAKLTLSKQRPPVTAWLITPGGGSTSGLVRLGGQGG